MRYELPRWRSWVWGLGLAALLATAWLAYRPGLSGGFLFDDLGSLPALGANGPINNSTAFLRYVTSGSADPTGRPIALASFLLDANDWPADPQPFKRTSILLHLLNGVLLTWTLLVLGRILPLPEPAARNAALLGASIWLLHPLLVSSTLYIVQREAMLPVAFTLAGLLGWIYSRGALTKGRVLPGLIGMTAAAICATLLATLCKANGALLPLLLLVCEATILRLQPFPTPELKRIHRRAAGTLLILPILLLGIWLLSQIPYWIQSARDIRDWTLGQRLLSEPRALVDYLRLWFLPRTNSSGIFNDAFMASRDWLHPWTTLPCIAVTMVLLGLGFALRSSRPAIAFGLLFFFAAHLMESTFLPLELYFEHRNYLPMLMLSWPIAIALLQPGARLRLRYAIATGIIVLLGLLTYSRASLWGDPYRQAIEWARQTPESTRAQAYAAHSEVEHGYPLLAALRLRNELKKHPDDIQISVNLIASECRMGATRPESLAAARYGLQRTRTGAELGFQWLIEAIGIAHDRRCSGLDAAAVEALVGAARANVQWQNLPIRQQDLDHIDGMLALSQGNSQRASQLFDHALAALPRAEAALDQAAMLGSSGYPALALEHLRRFDGLLVKQPNYYGSMEGFHAWLLHRQHYWQDEIAHLRATLKADLQRTNTATPIPTL